MNGSTWTNVSAVVTGLVPGSIYYYRIVATNESGKAHSSMLWFYTETGTPTLMTNTATKVGPNSATLHGTANAQGHTLQLRFALSLISGDYSSAAWVEATPGRVTGATTTPVSAVASNLVPGQTYYYRIITDGSTMAVGNEQSFTTPLPTTFDSNTIDILFVYTPKLRDIFGGMPQMEERIRGGVRSINAVLYNTGVDARFALVGMAQVTYDEIGKDTDEVLANLGVRDGIIDEVFDLAASNHADMVFLLMDSMGGQAYVRRLSGPQVNSEYVFGVGGPIGSVLEHELGHMLGLYHDWYEDGFKPPWPYALGHSGVRLRDIMTYGRNCTGCDPTDRDAFVDSFTNPTISYRGELLGVPIGTSIACQPGVLVATRCDSDAATAIDQNIAGLSSTTASVIRWTGASDASWDNPSNWALGTTQRVPLAIDDVLIPAGLSATRPSPPGRSIAAL